MSLKWIPLAAIGAPIFDLPPWALIPFGCMLLSIVLFPLLHHGFWERQYHSIVLILSATVGIYYIYFLNQTERVAHSLIEYFSFISLVGSLYIISSSIHISIPEKATPLRNSAFLAIGAILSNIIGTTGATMLLIRSWIKSNHPRTSAFHIAFFILIISNAGGCLTPIGDPPLLLGYLKGVPFFWTLKHLWQPWLLTISLLIFIFWMIDSMQFHKLRDLIHRESSQQKQQEQHSFSNYRITGVSHVVFLGIILLSIFLPLYWREFVMLTTAGLSYWMTPKSIHELNEFSFEPIREIAWLFFGIFITMTPALDYLSIHAQNFNSNSPMVYYWLTGTFSALLDNAPTYLTFLTISAESASIQSNVTFQNHAEFIQAYALLYPKNLMAISLGAVFFGALTYIGNGPNMMVKSIAEHLRIEMPGFIGFIFKYSVPILLPILALVGWLYFR